MAPSKPLKKPQQNPGLGIGATQAIHDRLRSEYESLRPLMQGLTMAEINGLSELRRVAREAAE